MKKRTVLDAFQGAGKPNIFLPQELERCMYCGLQGGAHAHDCLVRDFDMRHLDIETGQAFLPYGSRALFPAIHGRGKK